MACLIQNFYLGQDFFNFFHMWFLFTRDMWFCWALLKTLWIHDVIFWIKSRLITHSQTFYCCQIVHISHLCNSTWGHSPWKWGLGLELLLLLNESSVSIGKPKISGGHHFLLLVQFWKEGLLSGSPVLKEKSTNLY